MRKTIGKNQPIFSWFSEKISKTDTPLVRVRKDSTRNTQHAKTELWKKKHLNRFITSEESDTNLSQILNILKKGNTSKFTLWGQYYQSQKKS